MEMTQEEMKHKYATNIGNSISMYRVEFTDMYVAGNIYENPELLEVVE